jgi:integrase
MVGITAADVTAYIAKGQTDRIVTRKAYEVTLDDGTKQEVPAVTKPVSNGEINRELQILKRIFSLRRQRTFRRQASLQDAAGSAGSRRVLRARRVRRGPRAPPGDDRPAITFAYITGWRIPSEVLPLEWRQVDFTTGEVRLDAGTTKNGDGRVFPMTTDLRKVLKAQQVEHDKLKKTGQIAPWVFWRMVAEERGGTKKPQPIVRFDKTWKAACQAAGCPGRIPHDLRRTAVRNLVRASVPERVAMQLTGHKTPSVFNRYNITSPGDLRDAARRLDTAARPHAVGGRSGRGH